MNFLNSWLQGIVVAVVIATIIQMIMPNSNNKKYIKIVIGIYILFNIVSPIINKFSNSKFKIDSIIDTTKNTNKTHEVMSSNIEKINNDSIKQMYISNLKKDITAKLEEKGYIVNSIDINIGNNENYDIKDISINVKNKEDSNKTDENKIIINEIEKVQIQISEKEEIVGDKIISEFDKRKIKTYLATTYEIKEENINVY